MGVYQEIIPVDAWSECRSKVAWHVNESFNANIGYRMTQVCHYNVKLRLIGYGNQVLIEFLYFCSHVCLCILRLTLIVNKCIPS
jgi:hypothetical protein